MSCTTRPKKEENFVKPGNNYVYINDEQFDKKVADNDFVEWREINGFKYGTCKKEMQRINTAGRIPIIEVDTQGAIELNKVGMAANFLFIYPPSFEELRKRIGNRIETE